MSEYETEGVLRGACLDAALKALDEGRLFFRASDQYGRACNGGSGRVLPATGDEPGPWTERVDEPSICNRGWHATSDPVRWRGQRVALVEVDEVCERDDDKVVCHRLRELGSVVPWACVTDRERVACSRPDLYGANLGGANLYGANLRGADLRGADLGGADLGGADHDETTRWPEGFAPGG